jgi:PAS domain S-box-containing protein
MNNSTAVSSCIVPRIEANDVFRRLIESVADYAIFVLDPEGYIASWNVGAERLKGYKPDEIIGKHFSIFFTPEDLKANKPARELEVAASAGHFEDESWRVRKDGSRFWANVILTRLNDDEGNLIGFGKVTRDLTERRQAELRYRLLVEGVMDYAIFSMDPTGHITSWNVGAERIKGYSATEIIGQHFSRFYTEEDRRRDLPGHVLATAAETGHFAGEGWRVRKDGTRFWASVVVTALRDETGNLYGFSKVTRDMSDRKRLMDELQRHSQELELRVQEREQSNAELEAFAYSVSHDLRAPLRAISGFADALREDYGEQISPGGHEYLTQIIGAARRMNLLVQDLLDYGRVSRISLPLNAVQVTSALKDAINQLGTEERDAVTTDVPADLQVKAHPQVLTQILFNYLSNSFKFQPKAAKPEVHVSAHENNGFVRISVKDNGIGIAEQHRERIWNLFERLHDRDSYPGTGIGLAIVKRAVTRMQGGFGMDSKLGKGSTFWIDLPIADKVAEENNG